MKKLVLFLSLLCAFYCMDAQTKKPRKKKATPVAPLKDSNEYYINKAAQVAIDSMKARHLIIN